MIGSTRHNITEEQQPLPAGATFLGLGRNSIRSSREGDKLMACGRRLSLLALPVPLEMKPVEKPVQDRRDHNSGDNHEDKAAE